MKREVGRPSIDPAFRVRTKAWFIAASLASGMSAEELEIHFAPPEKQQMYLLGNRPGLWDKYRRGYICPKTKPDLNGRPSIVERVEKEFPGTADWISMPFWQVLSYTPMSMSEIKKVYLSLSEPIRDLIVMDDPDDIERMFWRTPADHVELYTELSECDDVLDAATAVLALIKEAEVTQNQNQHQQGLVCWACLAQTLRDHLILSLVMDDIDKIMTDRFTHVSYPDEIGIYRSIKKEAIRSVLDGTATANS